MREPREMKRNLSDARFVGRGTVRGITKVRMSSDTRRSRTSLNCSNSVHGGKIKQNLSEVELKTIKQEWRLQQQRMQAHERRKKILIKQYEILREQRLNQSTRGMRLFKGPEGIQMNSTELHKIKVDIYRKIPSNSVANRKLQRDIVNPEDVVVKRRAGEGSRPIFEKEDLTRAVSNTEEVKEHRKVVTVKDANLENKPQTSRRRSVSLSPSRNRSYSHRGTSFRHSRYEDYKQDDKENRRRNCDRDRSRERNDRRRTKSCHVGNEERLKKKKRRGQSQSRERDQTKWDRNSHHSKSIRGRSGERRMLSQQIPTIEQIPIPIYYGNFLPRPVMVRPLILIREQAAFGDSRHPMWPIRPFGPRFPPAIDMYRLCPPGNPKGFGPRY